MECNLIYLKHFCVFTSVMQGGLKPFSLHEPMKQGVAELMHSPWPKKKKKALEKKLKFVSNSNI